MQLKHIKPYLFILSIFLLPILFVPYLKSIKSKNNFTHSIEPSAKLDTTNLNFGIAIHGGAGNFTKESFSPEQEAKYKAKLYEALQLGATKLHAGDSAINVVVNVIKILEDSPLFNAGKGSVFTNNGDNKMDASIMSGIDNNAGAVAGVGSIKNPIEAAYRVMVNSDHVLLSGKGAESFAKTQNLVMVKPSYFFTEKQWKNLQKTLGKENEKFGTVGCVVLDKYGNLAAGTSTGGMTNKKYDRIGDSPIIGAGTYANNNTCAVSSTGHGEFFIRYNVAYDIAARIKYKKESLKQASNMVISELEKKGGNGGVICIDKFGNIQMPYNTQGMFRGYCKSGEEPQIFLY